MSVAARRAIVRWSWRLYRREWRQQVLLLALLTVTVAGAVLGAVTARQLTPSADGEFGTGTHRLHLSAAEPAALEPQLATIARELGPSAVVRSGRLPLPGTVNTVEYRSLDPHGAITRPMVSLLSGRYPTGDEVAITADLSDRLHLGVGGRLALDGVDRPIVGVIENPNDLADQLVLVAPNDTRLTSVTVIVRAPEHRIRALRSQIRTDVIAQRGQDERDVAAVAALSLALVAAILVTLVAAAGFVVIAQRRLRQLGTLAAIGATERHLRLVVVAGGAFIGAAGAVLGAGIAAVAWVLLSPSLETTAGHRLDRFDLPPWIFASGMLLALVTATAAAWWPGRVVARIPITEALSARPPRPRPVRRSTLAAVALIALGFTGLAVGIDTVAEEANPLYVLPGIGALVLGILLVSPAAIRALTGLGHHAPIAVRLALRDLARNQSRSGIALAAIGLALGLAMTTVILVGASRNGPTSGNLSDRTVLVRIGGTEPMVPALTADAVVARRDQVQRLADMLGGTVVPLQLASAPGAVEQVDGVKLRPAIVLGRPAGDVIRDVAHLYVATPELLRHLGLPAHALGAGEDVLTGETGPLRYANVQTRVSPTLRPFAGGAFSSAPTSFLTPAGMQRHGWEAIPGGWLLDAKAPLTPQQVTAARDLAVAAGLTVETRDRQESLSSTGWWATAGGMAIALAVLAMTVGLLRSEAAAATRTLEATGASTVTQRWVVAVTGGGLALAGVVLGLAGAYLALVASYLEDLDHLSSVPVRNLALTVFGLPLLAAVGGWLLSGRESVPPRSALT